MSSSHSTSLSPCPTVLLSTLQVESWQAMTRAAHSQRFVYVARAVLVGYASRWSATWTWTVDQPADVLTARRRGVGRLSLTLRASVYQASPQGWGWHDEEPDVLNVLYNALPILGHAGTLCAPQVGPYRPQADIFHALFEEDHAPILEEVHTRLDRAFGTSATARVLAVQRLARARMLQLAPLFCAVYDQTSLPKMSMNNWAKDGAELVVPFAAPGYVSFSDLFSDSAQDDTLEFPLWVGSDLELFWAIHGHTTSADTCQRLQDQCRAMASCPMFSLHAFLGEALPLGSFSWGDTGCQLTSIPIPSLPDFFSAHARSTYTCSMIDPFAQAGIDILPWLNLGNIFLP